MPAVLMRSFTTATRSASIDGPDEAAACIRSRCTQALSSTKSSAEGAIERYMPIVGHVPNVRNGSKADIGLAVRVEMRKDKNYRGGSAPLR